MLNSILNKFTKGNELTFPDLVSLLSLKDKNEIETLFQKAYNQKLKVSGNLTFIRGLIEFSNICPRDCYYCGIRNSNKNYDRYSLSVSDTLQLINFAHKNNYSSIVIQAGERQDQKFIDIITEILQKTKKLSNNKMRVTLSLGEQNDETYKKWFDTGAHRYLLRIETSNPYLYTKIHPSSYSLENRINCLKSMKKIGYQLGTGVLIGFPEQTCEDLAKDIMFFKDIDADMIGMGPYIPHRNTPMGKELSKQYDKSSALMLGLKMIAATRLHLRNVNIASTTALETLSKTGLEQGLLAGANVFMINMTDYNLKKSYYLYDNKPCFDTDISSFQMNIDRRLDRIGEKVAYGIHGDSKHYSNKVTE